MRKQQLNTVVPKTQKKVKPGRVIVVYVYCVHLGRWFTSMSQGTSLLSIMMSNPRTSKQLEEGEKMMKTKRKGGIGKKGANEERKEKGRENKNEEREEIEWKGSEVEKGEEIVWREQLREEEVV